MRWPLPAGIAHAAPFIALGVSAVAPVQAFAAVAGQPTEPSGTRTDDAAGLVASLSDYASAAFEHTPALALVVAFAALSLLLAVTGVLIRFAARLLRGGAAGDDAPEPDTRERTGFAPPRRVWLEAGEPGAPHYAISSEVTRIGREPDNDIRLDTPGADRYHASITRTPELDHYLVALTAEGRGLKVNGEATTRRRLRDGDIIDIAGVSLRFRAALR